MKGTIGVIFITVVFTVSLSGFRLAKAWEGKDAMATGIMLAEESQEEESDTEDSDQAEESDNGVYDDSGDTEDNGSQEEQPDESDEPAESEQPDVD